MLRAIVMNLLLVWVGQSFATGFEENPCRERSLSRLQLKQLNAEVHAATGLQLDHDPYSCSLNGHVSSYAVRVTPRTRMVPSAGTKGVAISFARRVAMEGERFTLWTLRYAIHFTADAPESALQLRCWRARKSPHGCMTTRCPA